MPKIAYITSGKIGIHSFTHNEIAELVKDHEVFLCLTQLNKGPYMPEREWTTLVPGKSQLIIPFLKCLFSSMGRTISMFRKARRAGVIPYFLLACYFYQNLKNEAITSIHCQMGDKKLYIGYFLKSMLRQPLSVNIHAHELYQRDVYDNPGKIKQILNNCDKIVTISEFNKNILMKDLDVPGEKIEVMRLFPEINRIQKIYGKTKILTVANWVEKKGYRVLFEAIDEMDRDDFILFIVGGHNYSDNSIDLEQLVSDHKLEDKVLLLGRFGGPQLDAIFSGCDVFCLPSITEYYDDGKPSEREGIPVVLMEAMAWGKPVISTHHAGIPELVEEILIDENNVEQLKSALEFLLENREKWKEMGDANRKIISEKYHSRNVSQLSRLFEEFHSSE